MFARSYAALLAPTLVVILVKLRATLSLNELPPADVENPEMNPSAGSYSNACRPEEIRSAPPRAG